MATVEWDHVDPERCEDKLKRIAAFIKSHEKCMDVIAATDIVPDVIRLDCMMCSENLQIRYEK